MRLSFGNLVILGIFGYGVYSIVQSVLAKQKGIDIPRVTSTPPVMLPGSDATYYAPVATSAPP